jgi:hypothetical protein
MAAARAAAVTTIFHISDLHFGLEDREALAWVREAIERERPALVARAAPRISCGLPMDLGPARAGDSRSGQS